MAQDIRDLADEEVMQLVQTGDPRAFELLYDRHGGAAFSLAYRMVGRQAPAEDVVQEAFLSIWRSRLRYDQTRGSVRTWILGIVHNRAIDGLRRASVHDRRREALDGRVTLGTRRVEGELAWAAPGGQIANIRSDPADAPFERTTAVDAGALSALADEARQRTRLVCALSCSR